MDDDRFADYLADGKSVRQKYAQRISVVAIQRRQVPCVVWMLTTARVVMGHGVRKRIVHIAAAVGPFVDMKPEYSVMAGKLGFWETVDLGADDNALIGLVEPDCA